MSEIENNYFPEEVPDQTVTISPTQDTELSSFQQIAPSYTKSEKLNAFIRTLSKSNMLRIDPRLWQQLFRINEIEDLRPKSIGQAQQGQPIAEPSFGEIADANFREMERCTVQKWLLVLNYFFQIDDLQKLQVHNADGRIRIAIPGSYLGFEIGAIIDFFNSQNLLIDIEAVDTGETGVESNFMNLDERMSQVGSTVSFHPHTDAVEHFKDTKQDIVIFRHPGPVYDLKEAEHWHDLFKNMLMTNPKIVIVSTYDYEVSSEAAVAELGVTDKKVKESDLFLKWLGEAGYAMPEAVHSSIRDESLYYPINPYNYPAGNEASEAESKRVMDRYMFVAVKSSS